MMPLPPFFLPLFPLTENGEEVFFAPSFFETMFSFFSFFSFFCRSFSGAVSGWHPGGGHSLGSAGGACINIGLSSPTVASGDTAPTNRGVDRGGGGGIQELSELVIF